MLQNFHVLSLLPDVRHPWALKISHSYQRSLHHHPRHSSHSQNVARGHRQFEVLVHTSQPTIDGLTDSADGLAPAEVFLDSLSYGLTDLVPLVPGRASVDRTATTARKIGRAHV